MLFIYRDVIGISTAKKHEMCNSGDNFIQKMCNFAKNFVQKMCKIGDNFIQKM